MNNKFKDIDCKNLVTQYNGKFKTKLTPIEPLIRLENYQVYGEDIICLTSTRISEDVLATLELIVNEETMSN